MGKLESTLGMSADPYGEDRGASADGEFLVQNVLLLLPTREYFLRRCRTAYQRLTGGLFRMTHHADDLSQRQLAAE